MEINAAGIVLSVAPFGEGDALVSVFMEADGIFRGLAKGGTSRAHASLWQVGNLVQVRWVARLADQLGSFSGELIHPGAALVMHDSWALGILAAFCAVAEGALPERDAQPRIFRGVLHLVAHSGEGVALLPEVVRWELGVLEQLGYGLDLTSCAVTGARENLVFASPRTGRAVSAEGAGLWRERLLPLPAFLTADGDGDMAQWADGLRLSGHFLARDAFGLRHKPLPAARTMLMERVFGAAGRDGAPATG